MSEQVSVEVGAGGKPVAVKRAHDDEGRARLRREAEVLEDARHSGVVELVDLDEQADLTTLATLWVGGGTIETADPPPRRLAAMAAQLARTLADLHDRGIVHGRITADHVLLDGLGRVVLAGLAGASTASESRGASPVDDVRGLAHLILDKLPPEHAVALPRLRASTADREVVDRLRAVAERAADSDPSRRPAARALASLLAEIAGEVPAPAMPRRLGRPEPTVVPPSHPLEPAYAAARDLAARLPGMKLLAAFGVVVAVLVVVSVGTRVATARGGAAALDPVTPHESTAHELTVVATTTPVSAPAPTSARVWPTSSPCAPMTDGGAEHHDVDGDGCSEPVTVTAGAVVVGDRRYEIGTTGRECGRLGLGLRRAGHARSAPARYRRALRLRLVGRCRRASDGAAAADLPGRGLLTRRRTAMWRAHRRRRVRRGDDARGRRVSSPRGAVMRALQLVATSVLVAFVLWQMRGSLPLPQGFSRTHTERWLLEQGPLGAAFALLRGIALLAALYTAMIGAIGLLAAVAHSSMLAAITVQLTIPSLRPLLGPVAAFTFTIGGALPAGASAAADPPPPPPPQMQISRDGADRGSGRAGDAPAAGAAGAEPSAPGIRDDVHRRSRRQLLVDRGTTCRRAPRDSQRQMPRSRATGGC